MPFNFYSVKKVSLILVVQFDYFPYLNPELCYSERIIKSKNDQKHPALLKHALLCLKPFFFFFTLIIKYKSQLINVHFGKCIY